jgi:hypothetical protein
MTRAIGVLRYLQGWLGIAVMAAGYAILGICFIGYLLAEDANDRMDLALAGGASGLGLLVVGAALVLAERSRGFAEASERTQSALLERLQALTTREARPDLFSLPELVVASGQSFHRPDCLLVAERSDLSEMKLVAALQGGRTACRLCLRAIA